MRRRPTVRARGGRAQARGGVNKRKSNDLGVKIIEQGRVSQLPNAFPPEMRIKKLQRLIKQNREAMMQVQSYASVKRAALLEAHLELAKQELNLPTIW